MNAPLIQPRVYDDPFEWFNGFFAPMFRRPETISWCLEWHEHEEAVQVVHAMWLTWEQVQADPTGDNEIIWLRDIMYPMMDRLTDMHGTFHGCDWFHHKHDPYTYALNDPPPES